ncbi:MAG: alpha/beta fold hydrolase [Acidobacteriota bacterium]
MARLATSERVVPFRAGDGFECNLIHVRGERRPGRGPVLLIHGSGVRANIFRAPVETNIVDALLARGYDVWLENWRASIDFAPNEWTLDEAAVHDHPAAVATVRRQTGAERLKAIIHCQGSTSFMMSAVAGLVPEVDTIVSNAVSLHPEVPLGSFFKAELSVDLLSKLIRYLDPQWARRAPGLVPKLIKLFVRLTHHECDNMVCKLSSFTYGTGRPTLWLHENLNEATHEWLKDELAHVPLTFFRQIRACLEAGHLVSVAGLEELPASFVDEPPKTDARFAFFAGEENVCFVPDSQQRTFDWLDALAPGKHSLHRIPGYSHLDIFMGEHAARDVYPRLLAALED